jgi:hypothetical protein
MNTYTLSSYTDTTLLCYAMLCTLLLHAHLQEDDRGRQLQSRDT